MFEDSTFESQGRIRTRSKRWMVAALGFNGSILAALVVIPLLYPAALPVQPTILIAALQPPQGPKPLPHQPAVQPTASSSKSILDTFQAPRQIPNTIAMVGSPEPRDIVGIPGGDTVSGGDTIGAIDDAFHHPSPTVNRSEPKVVRVSSGAEEGLIVSKTIPQYPVIARTMHVEGTVELAATISKAGMIENLRVVSGPVMLQQAALDAVKTWRYKPYMLDGQPVEVETSVNVVFKMER
jgi:protein TonB